MTDPLVIPCPHCNGLNRIPAARVGEHPKCGRCKNEVLIAKPFDLKQTDYASQIKGDLPLLVDVWAEWCGPCKMIAPILDEIAEEFEGKLTITKLSIDQNPATAPKYGIRGIPTLLLFKNGEVAATKVGALSKGQLKDFLNANL